MEFFNKKQDVIELKLTQFGRNLLSKGNFKPVYYAFFDDNILYDSEKAGFTELQNDSEERIRATQTMRTQTGFSSLEKDFDLLFDHFSKNQYDTMQKSAEKNYLLPTPIGTMGINSTQAPAWNVKFLNGSITSSTNVLTRVEKNGGKVVLDIPQLESIVELTVFQANSSANASNSTQSDTTVVSADERPFILLKMVEENSKLQKKNFDMEIFEIEEITEGGVKTETLRSLSFVPKNYTNSQILEEIGPTVGQEYADYYFDLRIDDEIGDDIICKYDTINENKARTGVFSERDTKTCEEKQGKNKTFDIYKDEEDYPGEIC